MFTHHIKKVMLSKRLFDSRQLTLFFPSCIQNVYLDIIVCGSRTLKERYVVWCWCRCCSILYHKIFPIIYYVVACLPVLICNQSINLSITRLLLFISVNPSYFSIFCCFSFLFTTFLFQCRRFCCCCFCGIV